MALLVSLLALLMPLPATLNLLGSQVRKNDTQRTLKNHTVCQPTMPHSKLEARLLQFSSLFWTHVVHYLDSLLYTPSRNRGELQVQYHSGFGSKSSQVDSSISPGSSSGFGAAGAFPSDFPGTCPPEETADPAPEALCLICCQGGQSA